MAATALVSTRLIVQAPTAGSTANSHVPGNIAPAFHPASSGVPLQMKGFHPGRCPLASKRPASTRSGKFWYSSSPPMSGRPAMENGTSIAAGMAR